ncbi:molybdopterin molybdotransferase [Bacillus ectoiniformans]|uniref:molybdopterin molybdotransferase MoeA n=1 Tax=Bacillus ectoiniformans TaxID=1494429 RepID=UPI00195AC4EA|nr:gephyrin-like molybdotransferase Glp [Bacillus ectoiniformans]MBM7649070.1 molybdopterin molybdotransferase [Bacillus ectoiniformans]
MVEKRTPVKVEKAIEQVMKYSRAGESEWVRIENAHGRFLGEDLIADHDVPSFNRSPYDGFAIRAEDSYEATREESVTLQVVAEIGAGSIYDQTVLENQAVRIMTGAQIPDGCDAVVMLELTETIVRDGKTFVIIKRAFKAGDNISFQGEDTKKGTVLAPKGTYINPGISALLATFGYEQVPVSKKPVVGVIATGSELLEVGEDLQPGKIRNSNTYMVLSQIERAGGEAVYFGQFSDELETCFQQVKEAYSKVDFLITTGGVSVGDYDYLPAIYEKLSANVLFNKIGMRPGSVTTIAELNGKLLFGLSGNPSACYVGFELFTRPQIRTYLHNARPHLRREKAYLGADFKKPNPFTRFVRAAISFEDGKLTVSPSGLDKSGVVSSLATADALIVLPGGTRGYEKGMTVDILLLEDQQGRSEI